MPPVDFTQRWNGQALGTDAIHVIQVELDLPASLWKPLESTLSEYEKGRVAAFHFEKDRRRYAVAHARLRTLLGAYLGIPAAEVAWTVGPHGKPSLPAGRGLYFNLSHSDRRALVAVSRTFELGVDLERHRSDVEFHSIAKRFFSPAECEQLLKLEGKALVGAFFTTWSRKEAYLKGRGDGLVYPLDAFEVSALPEAPAQLVANRRDPQDLSRWSLYALPLESEWSATLAVAGTSFVVTGWNFEA